MDTHASGSMVAGGYYLSTKTWQVATVPGAEGRLPGEPGERFLHLPVPLLLAGAPLLGGLYFVAIPLLTFGTLLGAGLRAAGRLARESAGSLLELTRPGWRPGEAHLAGRAPDAKSVPDKADAALDALQAEIDAKRKAADEKR